MTGDIMQLPETVTIVSDKDMYGVFYIQELQMALRSGDEPATYELRGVQKRVDAFDLDQRMSGELQKRYNIHPELVKMVQRFVDAIAERKLNATPEDTPLAMAHCDAIALLALCKKAGCVPGD